jgi:hypothetical protein
MSTNAVPSIPFPGTVIAAGSADKAAVLAIQRRLNQLGCGPVAEDGVFGIETTDAVELCQARSVDKFGAPLKVDGQVGPMTWGTLFGDQAVPKVSAPSSALQNQVLTLAASEIGTLEIPLGSNRGPKIDLYLRAVGLDPTQGSFPWCAAFVYFCFQNAASALRIPNPVVKTAGVLDHWNRAGKSGIPRVSTADATANPSLVRPGMIFVITTGNGNGHTGLVEAVDGVQLATIEGNTNLTGSREGIGVFRHSMRRIAQINKGYIDYR